MEDLLKAEGVYFDFGDFIREVRKLNIIDLRPVGVVPDTLMGAFWPHRLEELKELCEDDPRYHILPSMPGGMMLNCLMAGAHHYYLCAGNSNPRLVCKSHLTRVWFSVAE